MSSRRMRMYLLHKGKPGWVSNNNAVMEETLCGLRVHWAQVRPASMSDSIVSCPACLSIMMCGDLLDLAEESHGLETQGKLK